MSFGRRVVLRTPTETKEASYERDQSSTRITEVGTVIVPVSDQDRAIEFYTETLGFEIRGDTPYGDGDRWVEVAPRRCAATTIALVPPREGQSVGVPDQHRPDHARTWTPTTRS